MLCPPEVMHCDQRFRHQLNLAETSTIMWLSLKWKIMQNCSLGSLPNYGMHFIQFHSMELLCSTGKYQNYTDVHTCNTPTRTRHIHTPFSVQLCLSLIVTIWWIRSCLWVGAAENVPYPVCYSPPGINLQQWPVRTSNDLEHLAQPLVFIGLNVCVW